jgi:hypothetical protein
MFAFKGGENQETLKKLADFLGQAKQEFHPQVPMQFWSNPLKKFDTYQRKDGKPNAEYLKGYYWVNASSGEKFPPVVVDASRQPVISEAEIYSGRNAVVNISFYAFAVDGQFGLSTNILAVMLQEGGNKEGGSYAVDINTVFGGFQEDMGIKSAPANQNSVANNQTQAGQQWPPQNNNNGSFV